ncbi:MAG: 50S ribosomal protein L25/general stress protein Ctc [Pseudomonadota bacterium]
MSDVQTINAEKRERAGKGASRAVRRLGRVPAVIYGDKKSPVNISLAQNELVRLLNRGTFMSSIFDVDFGEGAERCLPRDMQVDPVTDQPMHIDFLRIAKGASVTVEVPANFINEELSPGLKGGGVLNVVRYDIEVDCPADSIPDRIEVSLEGLELGDSLHISQVQLPEGVKPSITDRDFTIATVVAPSGLKSAEAEEAEAEAEGGEAEGEASTED